MGNLLSEEYDDESDSDSDLEMNMDVSLEAAVIVVDAPSKEGVTSDARFSNISEDSKVRITHEGCSPGCKLVEENNQLRREVLFLRQKVAELENTMTLLSDQPEGVSPADQHTKGSRTTAARYTSVVCTRCGTCVVVPVSQQEPATNAENRNGLVCTCGGKSGGSPNGSTIPEDETNIKEEHQGSWVLEKNAEEFIALPDELKNNMRTEKQKRLKRVISEMEFVIDSDDPTLAPGAWSCCSQTDYSAPCSC